MKRPWGRMWKLISHKRFWLKLIAVKGRTSLQSHAHRMEWHLGFYKVKPGEKHRLLPGVYLEFVHGPSADERDIVRYEDDYGRAAPKERRKVVMVSGGFDPLHVGHLEMIEEAKKLGEKLVVVLNCDAWLLRKKGKYFMNQDDRAALLASIRQVDEVFVLETERDDVGEAIEKFRPDIFANGGDRKDEASIPESAVCRALGVEMVFNVGKSGKIRSSSELLREYASKEGKGDRSL